MVFRHEQTLSKPKADRLNLLRATQAHFGQLFMLYSDPAAEIDAGSCGRRPADGRSCATNTVCCTGCGRSRTRRSSRRVQAKMADKKLIIADGHHRYETALNYRNEMRKQAGDDSTDSYERVMMTFVNMDAPGLVILPTHRVVFGLENFSIFEMVAKLQAQLRGGRHWTGDRHGCRAVERLREAGKDRTALLAVTAHGGFLLRSRPDMQLDGMQLTCPNSSAHSTWCNCTSWCWKEHWGCRKKTFATQKHLRYMRDAGEAADEVRKGRRKWRS